MRRLALTLLLTSTLLVGAAGCGGDDSTSKSTGASTTAKASSSDNQTRSELADHFKTQLADDQTVGDSGISDDQADCMAVGVIAQLGSKRAKELDAQDDVQLTNAEADKVIPVLKKCLNFGALIAQGLLESAEGKISQKSADCVSNELASLPFVEQVLKAALTGGTEPDVASDPNFTASMFASISKCLTPEELTSFMSN